MDYELVRKAAKARPEYEFVFIGRAISDTAGIEGLSNVHLLGQKPYEELAAYARHFNVATIPFMQSDAMNCVSPIKFYEYCALGLPVVCSRMEEVAAKESDSIACYEDEAEYLRLLDAFAQPKVKASAGWAGPLLAAENTWGARAEAAQEALERSSYAALAAPYKKHDVIVLAIIDFDFRFQRPQHFATHFAAQGHRVFYVNANHHRPDSVNRRQDNLYTVDIYSEHLAAIHSGDWAGKLPELKQKLDGLLQAHFIRDAVVLVDYPNWLYGAEYLRSHYGFKLICDYMDDFTGFLNPAEELVRQNCEALLRTADGVVASSAFLYDIARSHNKNTALVRNGAEAGHFARAYRPNKRAGRPVLGYYGAVAEWFDAEKVLYLARQMPDCEVVIVGEVTANAQSLAAQPNIRLAGEKPYDELPDWLADFDVCLIPFDTSTDLIKATNPVKFYEYLSAGKKIVATEISELMPYRDKYVYLANGNRQFADYVKLCLEGRDSLCGAEEAMELGRQNNWMGRCAQIEDFCRASVPLASVVVLCYNNLAYNQLCIESILEKTAYPNYELIVVDNASKDGTPEYLLALAGRGLPNVKIILNEENMGFAGGNNIGIEAAAGEYVVLLNNDTVVTRGWLTALVKHLENDEGLGMSGSVTNSIGNEAKIEANYNSFFGLERFAYQYTSAHMGRCFGAEPRVLAMFAVAIRRKLIDRCGALDEGYARGMFEDDDYARAAREAGYRLCIAEDSYVHHFHSLSFNQLESEDYMRLFEANRLRYEQKWRTKWVPPSYREGVFPHTNCDNNLAEGSAPE